MRRLSFCRCVNSTQEEKKNYSDLVDNFPNLRLKAHVQHSVCLIQHKISTPAEVRLSCFKEVNEPSWSGDADLHTLSRKVTSNDLKL